MEAADIKRSILSDDILFFGIIILLPLRYVVQLRCVCKTWYTLLKDHHFLDYHRRRHRQIMISYPSSSSPGRRTIYQSIEFDETNVNFPTILRTHTPPHPNAKLVGSCNEFLLLHKVSRVMLPEGEWHPFPRFFLWNPTTTRECVEIPREVRLVDYKEGYKLLLCGVGLDPITQDLKILVQLDGPVYPQIYTRKTNSWKRVATSIPKFAELPFPHWYKQKQEGSHASILDPLAEPIKPESASELAGVYVGGYLHWSMQFTDAKRHSGYALVSFDLTEEEYKLVPLPNKFCSMPVSAFDGLLCVGDHNWDNVDLWVMKEYGVTESWTKLLRVWYPLAMGMVRPLCFTHNGEVILQPRVHQIVKCDPKAKSGEGKILFEVEKIKGKIASTLFGVMNQVL